MRRSGPPQMVCADCGSQMRLDDQDEIKRGVYKYWFVCSNVKCNVGCTLDGSTGETFWDMSLMEEDQLPF